MEFVLEDFNEEAQYAILENHKEILDNTDTDTIAVLSTPLIRKAIGKIAAEWKYISKLIEILKETGNNDFHLYYDNCDI